MITVFGVTAIISKPGRSFPHWLASIVCNAMHCMCDTRSIASRWMGAARSRGRGGWSH